MASALRFSFFRAQRGITTGSLPNTSSSPRMPVASHAFVHNCRCRSQSSLAAFIVLYKRGLPRKSHTSRDVPCSPL